MSNLHRPQDCTVAPRRFAAYIRVSTRDQAEEGFSLEAQRDRLAAHVEREGGKLVAVYSDAGITGRADDRPELQRALADAEAGKFDALAVIKLDRFGRSNRALHENFERLARADVEFTSLFEAIDTTTAVGRFMRGIFASLAEFESDVIGTRVAAVTARRARAGKHNGGPRPYGFAYADDGGGLVPVVDEAAIVRRCFAEFAGGKSQARIARDLNAEGIRSAQGGDWHPGVVSNMLGREIYIGCVTLKGETFPGQHDAIIDADLWERVQTLRAASRKSPGGGRGRPTAGSHLFVRGALRCGECGEAIIPITKPNRSGSHYEAYDCYGRQRKKNGCTLGPIPRALIDTAVCDYFMEVGLDVEATREQLAAHQDRALAETAALLDRAERDAHTADERLARVRRHYQDGKLDPDDWAEQRDQLTSEAAAARRQLDQLRTRDAEARASFDPADVEAETLHRLAEVRATIAGTVRDAQTIEATRAALNRLFEGFTLHHLSEDADGRSVAPEPRWWAPELTLPGYGGLYVEPHVRPQAIDSAAPEGYEGEVIFPTLHREPIPMREKNTATG